MVNEWFIPFNTPSLKNGKIKGKKGIFHSKAVKEYLTNLGIQDYSSSKKIMKNYKTKPNLFLKSLEGFKIDKYPVKLGFHFVRSSERKWDFINICQILLDLLTASNLIEDDNMNCVIPFAYQRDNKWYTLDKNRPGVYIKILE